MSVPANVKSSDVYASKPVRIEEILDNAGLGKTRRINISGIGPTSQTHFLIPLAAIDQKIEALNAEHLKLNLLEKGSGLARTKEIVFKTTADAIAALPIFLMLFFFIHRTDVEGRKKTLEWEHTLTDMRAEINAQKNRQITFQEMANRFQREADEAIKSSRSTSARIKVLLLSKVLAQSRELSFWRDAVKRMFLAHGTSQQGVDDLFREVTNSLKTWTAYSGTGDEDFNTVVILADMMKRHESTVSSIQEANHVSDLSKPLDSDSPK